MTVTLYKGDCLEEMKKIPSNSVDLILCDLPYGVTVQTWDKIINFDVLWQEYERVITDCGAIVLFASESFTYKLIQSNYNLFRYKWIWIKNTACNFVNAKTRPMTKYEEILVFSKGTSANNSKNKMNYFPQGLKEINKKKQEKSNNRKAYNLKKTKYTQQYTNYPVNVLNFKAVPNTKKYHTNQKPTELLEYLVKTYTTENMTVLDNAMGSGSTGVACVNTNRNFIGIERDEEYFKIAENRINDSLEKTDR